MKRGWNGQRYVADQEVRCAEIVPAKDYAPEHQCYFKGGDKVGEKRYCKTHSKLRRTNHDAREP